MAKDNGQTPSASRVMLFGAAIFSLGVIATLMPVAVNAANPRVGGEALVIFGLLGVVLGLILVGYGLAQKLRGGGK